MTSARPTTVPEYLNWARAELNVEFGTKAVQNRYDSNLQPAQNAFQESQFVRALPSFIAMQGEEYSRRTGTTLLIKSDLPILRKPFASAVEKSFRHNVLWNRNYPSQPKRG